MDKRFLFRGKRNDNLNKGWVIGHYVSVPRHMIILTETMLNGSWNCFDVDPDTVGPCTGLIAAKSYRGNSEDDRLVFEGDIVKVGSSYVEIRWNNETCSFYPREVSGIFMTENLRGAVNCEILGNIHEHPYLIDRE